MIQIKAKDLTAQENKSFDLSQAYAPGQTEVWFWNGIFAADMLMGVDWLRKRNMLPDPDALDRTHVKIGTLQEQDPDRVYHMMQGEMWSPNGEARDFISASGSSHTSMSIGDIVVIGGKVLIVDRVGFEDLRKVF